MHETVVILPAWIINEYESYSIPKLRRINWEVLLLYVVPFLSLKLLLCLIHHTMIEVIKTYKSII